MGCFGDRKPKHHAQASSSFCYPESFLTDPTRQANYCYYPSPALPSRSSLLVRHSCSFNLTHSRPSFASSPLTQAPNSHSVSDCLSDIGAVRRCSSYGYGDERSAVSCSSTPASLFASENNEQTGGEPRLFPLPLPPSASSSSSTSSLNCICHDDVSSGSGSSVCAASPRGALARSVNSKSFSNNSLGLASSTDADQSVQSSHPSPLPLPLPPQGSTVNLREFSHEELAGACLNFAQEFFLRDGGVGPVFRTVIKNHETCSLSSIEAAVTKLTHVGTLNNFKKWRVEVSSLARLSHPHLCKVAGFSGEDCGKPSMRERERLLVYEHPVNGSLDGWLYCRKGKAPVDWITRLKIAMGAAQGLAYLHNRRPRQLIYKSFKSINIQLDENFDAKLSDYGFARNGGEQVASNLAAAPMWDAYNAPETCTSGELSAQSNVWSFGIVLLELLTGRQTMDDFFPTEEKDLLQWCRPYLLDTKRLYLIMDPELKGRYPTRTAKLVANLALQCLAKDPMDRPSMHDVAESLCALVETSNACNKKTNHVPTAVHHSSTKVVKPFNTPSGDRLTSTPRANQVSRFKMASSHNLVSVLASPARVFLRSDDANHIGDFFWGQRQRARFGLLPGEKNKRASDTHQVGNSNHHMLSRNLEFLSGEIGLQGKRISGSLKSISPFSPDFPSPPPLGRAISASSRLSFMSG